MFFYSIQEIRSYPCLLVDSGNVGKCSFLTHDLAKFDGS